MTSTILRVKRRLEDDPQDALVLMCKRIKKDTEEISSSLFIFRGTVDNQETTSVKDIVPKNDTKLKPTHNVNDVIEKIRKERKDVSTQHRYEVVNCSRGLDNHGVDGDEQFDLVDLAKTTDKESDIQYAYDLYISEKQDFDVSMLDDLVSVENYQDIIFGSHRDNGRRTPSSDEADDDDDSNDENNWRNDYPDSDPSIDEEDIIRAMEKCDVEDDLSSDTGEDNIYDGPPHLFNEDIKRYGAAYAKYKAKVLAEDPDLANGRSLVHCTQIDYGEDSDGYKDDDDDGFYYGQEEDKDHFREQYGNDLSDPD